MKIINFLFQISIFIICILLLISSETVMHKNFKYFHKIKTGVITSINYKEGSLSDGQKGVYINKIVTDNDTIYAGSQKLFSVSESIRYKYLDTGRNKIFEVNNKVIGSKYDLWEWLSHIIFILMSLVIIKFIRLWVQLIKLR